MFTLFFKTEEKAVYHYRIILLSVSFGFRETYVGSRPATGQFPEIGFRNELYSGYRGIGSEKSSDVCSSDLLALHCFLMIN